MQAVHHGAHAVAAIPGEVTDWSSKALTAQTSDPLAPIMTHAWHLAVQNATVTSSS